MVAYRRVKAGVSLLGLAFASSPPFGLTVGSAAADPVFSINAALSAPDGVISVIGSQASPIVSSRTHEAGIPGAAVTVSYGAIAKPGNLGSLSTAAAVAPGAYVAGSASAVTDVALDNIEIIDPSLAAGTPINYSINFEVRGTLVVAAFGASSAHASVQLNYHTAPGTGVTLGTADASTVPGDSGASGIFSGGIGDVKTHAPVEIGFVGHDVFAEFILATDADVIASPSASGFTQGQASASSDFIDPFSFPTDGPVFNFFDANGDPLTGATVDSSDGCIANNRFLCGGGPTTVPEQSTWTMLVFGFGALGAVTLYRRRLWPANDDCHR